MNWLRDALRVLASGPRLLFFRKILPGSFALSLSQTIFLLFVSFAVDFAAILALNSTVWGFDATGLNAVVAQWVAIALLLAAFKTRTRLVDIRELLAAFAVANTWITVTFSVIAAIATPAIKQLPVGQMLWASAALGFFGLAMLAWYFLTAFWAGRQLSQFGQKRFGLRAAAACILALVIVPQDRFLLTSSSDMFAQINIWSWIEPAASDLVEKSDEPDSDSEPKKYVDLENLLDRQPALVETELAKIKSASGSGANFYFIGMAASSAQDVFSREIQSTRAVFDERFNTAGRSIILNNDSDTVDTIPIASVTNLRKVLAGTARKMNIENDVAVLFLTSHGSEGLLSVNFLRAPLNPLSSKDLSQMLDDSGIKNRVIIISACHSGSFIPDLKNDNTIVLTASRADTVSFGCSNERDWTYFSDALVNHALRTTVSFPDAFQRARDLIAEWEKRDSLSASDPQMFAGDAIRAKLDAMSKSATEKKAAAVTP